MKVVCYKCKSLIRTTPNVLGRRTFKILCMECYSGVTGDLHLGQESEAKADIQIDNNQLLPFIMTALLVNNG